MQAATTLRAPPNTKLTVINRRAERNFGRAWGPWAVRKLARAIKYSGKSYATLADETGVSTSCIAALASEKTQQPFFSTVAMICPMIGIPLDSLFDDD